MTWRRWHSASVVAGAWVMGLATGVGEWGVWALAFAIVLGTVIDGTRTR